MSLRRIAGAYDDHALSLANLAWHVGERHRNCARRRAAGDTEWERLNAQLAEASCDEKWDLTEARDARAEKITPKPWWVRAADHLTNVRARDLVLNIETRFWWAVRGWAPSDTWSLDQHLCRTLGAQLHHLAEHTHSHPGQFTSQQWDAALRAHSRALLTYSREVYDEPAPETVHAAQDAFRWVAEHLPHLWD